jgi:hypothetical protein
VVLPAPLAVGYIRCYNVYHNGYGSCTSNQQGSTARRQVEKHFFEPTRAIRELVAQILHVN